MKKLFASLLIFVTMFLSSCAQNSFSQFPNERLTIELLSPVFPPLVGIDELVLRVTDSQTGLPVSDAYLSVRGQGSIAGLVPILSSSKTGIDGEYVVPFEWTAGGDWIVTVNAIMPDGDAFEKTFDVAVDGDDIICGPIVQE